MASSRNILIVVCTVLCAAMIYLSVSAYIKSAFITTSLSKQCLDELNASKLESYAKSGEVWLFSTISDKLALCGDYSESNRLASLGREHGNSMIYFRDVLRIEREVLNNINHGRLANVEPRIETALKLLSEAKRNNIYSFYDVRFGVRESLNLNIDRSIREFEQLKRELN